MAKGRGSQSREEKKPKADKKPATIASTSSRSQAADSKTVAKESKK